MKNGHVRKIMIIGTNVMNLYSHRLELISRLQSLGYHVIVVCPDRGDADRLRHLGCTVDSIDFDSRGKNPAHDLQLLKAIKKIIRAERPDLVYTFYTKTNIYGGLAARSLGVPYIENITGLGSGIARGGLLSKVMMKLYMAAIGKASYVYFQNKRDLGFFRSHGIDPKVCHLLPGSGVSLHRFYPLPYPDEKPATFSFISRILDEKGINEYLEAAKIIRETHPDTRFLVVGPCASASHLAKIKEYEKHGIISYHPQSSDIRPFLEMSHCNVFPSYYAEGMANILLESAACGRPVITTSMPGCGETVDDGKTGFIVKPRNVGDLVKQIEKILLMTNEQRKAMGMKGRKKVEKEFNREIVTEAYIDATEKILGPAPVHKSSQRQNAKPKSRESNLPKKPRRKSQVYNK